MKRQIDISRLADAIQKARLALRFFRDQRREAVRQYVGSHWSEEGSDRDVPVNLIALYLSIVARNLIAKNPRVMLSTFDREAKPVVSAMEDWANDEIKQMRFANTMQRVVVDALWCLGICKVGLASPADSAHVSWRLSAGQPFAERVDLDDFVFDTHARDFSEVQFIGHRIRRPFDLIADSKLYAAARKELSPSYDNPYNVEGDERISMLGRSYYEANAEEFEPMVDLWEIYLPRRRVVVTLADEDLRGAGGKVLREQEWIGPDSGPYHLLGYGIVPGNAMPKGPIQDLLDLHLYANNVYRKLDRQAERQKELLPIRSGATEDGGRIVQGNDGDVIRCDNDSPQAIAFGGPNQQNAAWGIHVIDQFMKFAGNLEMMGGLAPQSKTLGQDEMLQKNAHGGVADMQDRTVGYTSEVLESLLWFWHHHPQKVMSSRYQVPGAPDVSLNRKVTPEQRAKVDLPNIDVDPYSMQHSTPQGRIQGLTQFVTQVYLPAARLFAQQGVSIDLQAYAQKYGKLMDMPDLADIITIQEPLAPEAAGGGGEGSPTKPPETTRNYVRRSLGGDTGQNRDAQIANMTPSANGAKQPAGAQ